MLQLPYEINVYEAGTHAHKLGRVLWYVDSNFFKKKTKNIKPFVKRYEHFRNNNRIRWGPINPHYDFNRQIGKDIVSKIIKNFNKFCFFQQQVN